MQKVREVTEQAQAKKTKSGAKKKLKGARPLTERELTQLSAGMDDGGTWGGAEVIWPIDGGRADS